MKSSSIVCVMLLLWCVSSAYSQIEPYEPNVLPPESFSIGDDLKDSTERWTPDFKLGLFLGGNYNSPGLSDIEGLLDDYNACTGYGWAFAVNVGFRDIVQVEYKKAYSTSSLTKIGNFSEYSVVGGRSEPNLGIAIDYNHSETLIKLNPLFGINRAASSIIKHRLYLVFGVGDVEYVDTVKDGFRGESIVYGVEFDGIEVSLGKHLSAIGRIGLTIHDIKFTRATFMGVEESASIDGMYYGFEASVGIGFGI